jgi:hypothetical protein
MEEAKFLVQLLFKVPLKVLIVVEVTSAQKDKLVYYHRENERQNLLKLPTEVLQEAGIPTQSIIIYQYIN